MQQVLINIENKEIENRLRDEANRRGWQPSDIIMEFLEKKFLQGRENRKLRVRKLNPLKHITRINFDIDIDESDDLVDVFPFKDVKDSAEYVTGLRKNAWRR
jgi:hypothetical protein